MTMQPAASGRRRGATSGDKNGKMILHNLIPQYHFSEKHEAMTRASPSRVYQSIFAMDLSQSALVKVLFTLRRMPRTSLTLAGMQQIGFTVLGRDEDRELVIGLVGRFWKPVPELVEVSPQTFRSFNEKGYAKVALNFFIEETAAGCALSTTTRVFCTSTSSRVAFSAYWAFIRPWSGLIRRAMLNYILRGAEHQA